MGKRISVGYISQVPQGEGRNFLVGEEQVAVFHTRDGKVFASESHCPHRRGPLADGLLGGTRITCPLHERTFDLATGAPLNGDCGIRVFPASCGSDGTLVVELA